MADAADRATLLPGEVRPVHIVPVAGGSASDGCFYRPAAGTWSIPAIAGMVMIWRDPDGGRMLGQDQINLAIIIGADSECGGGGGR